MKKLQKFLMTVGLFAGLALTACVVTKTPAEIKPTLTDDPKAGLANPASVYCTEHGNTLEIRTAEDGSQYGVCIFADMTECDEWAYFRSECGVETQVAPIPTTTIEETTEPSGGGPGGGDPAGEGASGGYMEPGTSEEFADWWGIINSTPSGAQYDDYFERRDLEQQYIYFGIDSMDPAVKAQIDAVRDTGKIVHLYGTLFSNVADYNGSQVQVSRIVVEEDASGGYMEPGTSEEFADWWGVINSTPYGAQYDDYFERRDLEQQFIYFGIDAQDPAVQAQIDAVRDTGKIVHLYGTLFSNVPDYNGSQVLVSRIEIEG